MMIIESLLRMISVVTNGSFSAELQAMAKTFLPICNDFPFDGKRFRGKAEKYQC